ncbi:MAG: DUF4145 domain-containing protein, partial [Campylobacterota bacterium]|nr:DUF4145 domain-containing protein [Campylobacterota bacterium]
MTFDFYKFQKDISRLRDKREFEIYLESNFIEIEEFLLHITDEQIDEIKFDIEDLLYDLLDDKYIEKENSRSVNAFLILLAEKFLQTSLIGSITIISDYLPNGATKVRLEAAKLYLRVNDISRDYKERLDDILKLLETSAKIDEYNTKAIKSFLYFVHSALYQFQRVENKSLASSFSKLIFDIRDQFELLKDGSLEVFFSKITSLDIASSLQLIANTISGLTYKKSICTTDNVSINIESSEYSSKLYNLKNINFDTIRDIAYKYIQSIGDPQELYEQLRRGEKIIDDEKLLSKYLASFGGKHKLKLYSAYDEIFDKLKTEKFDIVDWGCGQATATMLLLDYAREKDTALDIENITLIEPSKLALQRGLLHIDLLKQKEYKVKAINSDLDCLDPMELEKNSKNKTLHIFSNILDIESFSLDNKFFKKVSSGIDNDSIFICVSPNRNDKLNNRLDLFYKYFDESFDTELLSSRDTDIGNSTRYEKVFEVKYTEEVVVQEVREKIEVVKSNYQLNIIEELAKYENYVTPVLNLELLENSINVDPEYAIFKIRKVAEVITSKIYSKYEDNIKQVSFNDKIRYLSYEKKDFDKTITNYVHTLRTIGNRGVHDNQSDITKLKLDAHLMVVALISFITHLLDKKLLT